MRWSSVQQQRTRSLFGQTATLLVKCGSNLHQKWLLSPNGLQRISLVRASEGAFKTIVFDAFEEPINPCPIMPSPAPPCLTTVRCPVPICLLYVRFLVRQIGNSPSGCQLRVALCHRLKYDSFPKSCSGQFLPWTARRSIFIWLNCPVGALSHRVLPHPAQTCL